MFPPVFYLIYLQRRILKVGDTKGEHYGRARAEESPIFCISTTSNKEGTYDRIERRSSGPEQQNVDASCPNPKVGIISAAEWDSLIGHQVLSTPLQFASPDERHPNPL